MRGKVPERGESEGPGKGGRGKVAERGRISLDVVEYQRAHD